MADDNDGGESTTNVMVQVNVNSINDAPTLDSSAVMSFTVIDENDADNAGNTVASIIASAGGDRITDPDGDQRVSL